MLTFRKRIIADLYLKGNFLKEGVSMKKKMFTRRKFISTSLGSLAGFSILKRTANGQSANNKLNIAFIGSGGIARSAFSGCQRENFAALCDVDFNHARSSIKKFKKKTSSIPRFDDYRVMLDKMGKKIDAVVVSTPDHTHFPAAMEAMQRGKHVYVQKPLAHDIWQVRTLKKAADKYKVITQMGNQGHATSGIRSIKEWYDAGVLGDVREIYAWFNGPNFNGKFFKKPDKYPLSEDPVPRNFKYDLWLGPVKKRPYSNIYHPRTWRGFFYFGSGEFGDWACHTLDAPYWALQLGMPENITPLLSNHNVDFVPDSSVITVSFAARGNKPPVTLYWYDGYKKPKFDTEKYKGVLPPDINEKISNTKNGMMMIGEKCALVTGGRPNSPKLWPDEFFKEFKKNMPPKSIPRVKGGPFKEWIKCIKKGKQPGSNFNYSAGLSELTLLGVLSQRIGKPIEWDAENMLVKGHPEYDSLIKIPPRKGWKYGEKL